MNRLKRLSMATVLLTAFFSLQVSAAETNILQSPEVLGEMTVLEKTPTHRYVVIKRAGGGNYLTGSLGCGAADKVALDRNEPNFDEIFAALLAAKVRGDLVTIIADGCSATGGNLPLSVPLIKRITAQ